MSKNALYLLMAFFGMSIVLNLFQQLGIDQLILAKPKPFAISYLVFGYGCHLVFYTLFLVLLTTKKYWFALVSQVLILLNGLLISLSYYFFSNPTDGLSLYFLLNVALVYLLIINGIAFIWTDRKNRSWLTYYGGLILLYALFILAVPILKIRSHEMLTLFLSAIPAIALFGYFYSEYKRAEGN